MSESEPTREERRAAYHKVLRTVLYNSGNDHQPPAASETSIRVICCAHADMSSERFDKVLRAASENGDLARGSGYLWHPEAADAADAIKHVVETTDDPRDFVAAVNQIES